MSTSRFQAGCHHHRPSVHAGSIFISATTGGQLAVVAAAAVEFFFFLFFAVVNLSRVYIGGGANVTATFGGTAIHLAGRFTWLIKPRTLQKQFIIHFSSVPKVIYFRPALVTCGEKPQALSITMPGHIEPVDGSQGGVM